MRRIPRLPPLPRSRLRHLPQPARIAGQTYADLVDLALASPVVVRATIHRQFRLKPDESPGLAPGFARLYFEADTTALLVGPDLGESLRFLADVPTDAAGKVPKLAKTPVMVFGKVVPNRPGELQLTAPDTMLPWTPALDSQIRAILTELIKPDAPPAITGVREALHVPGNLAGEGETQFFFATANARPVSISVVRRPGEPTRWGVSFGEISPARCRRHCRPARRFPTAPPTARSPPKTMRWCCASLARARAIARGADSDLTARPACLQTGGRARAPTLRQGAARQDQRWGQYERTFAHRTGRAGNGRRRGGPADRGQCRTDRAPRRAADRDHRDQRAQPRQEPRL
jgi:hypothetical protein